MKCALLHARSAEGVDPAGGHMIRYLNIYAQFCNQFVHKVGKADRCQIRQPCQMYNFSLEVLVASSARSPLQTVFNFAVKRSSSAHTGALVTPHCFAASDPSTVLPNSTLAMNHDRIMSIKAHVSCSFTSLKCTILRNCITLPSNVKNHPSSKNVVRTATNISDRKILQRPFLTSRDSRRVRITSSASSDEYNQMMTRQMKNPYEYHHELGMYYHKILDTLYVGSQPQTPDDITRLANEEGVTAVLNLQQDHDISYWGIDLQPILARCQQLGVAHYRRPARDFDPNSLRYELPKIVSVIDRCISEGSKVYVHCTAGLGRAPGAAISYLYWFRDMDLDGAYNFLTTKRPCGPKREAIRGATYDLAKEGDHQPPLDQLPEIAFSGVSDLERQLIQRRVRESF